MTIWIINLYTNTMLNQGRWCCVIFFHIYYVTYIFGERGANLSILWPCIFVFSVNHKTSLDNSWYHILALLYHVYVRNCGGKWIYHRNGWLCKPYIYIYMYIHMTVFTVYFGIDTYGVWFEHTLFRFLWNYVDIDYNRVLLWVLFCMTN